MKRPVCLLPVAIGCLLAQTSGVPKREGSYWTQANSATIVVVPGSRLKVGVRGQVTIRGEDRENIVYTLKKRVTARDAAHAEALMSGWSVKAKTIGDTVYLIVMADSQPGSAPPELEMRVPRSLRQVSVENQGGSVEARDLDGDFSAEASGGRLNIDRIGRNVVARTAGGDVMLGRIGGSARCLSGGGSITVDSVAGESWLETAGGEIRVREAAGPVRASTAGNIIIERAAQTVLAQSSGGMIEVQQAGGKVTAEASAGSLHVISAPSVSAELGMGPIRLNRVSGTIRVSTGLGTVLADLPTGETLRDSVLNTAKGDVIVNIPSNLAVRVWAQSDTACRGGRIVSDFSEIRVPPAETPCVRPLIAEGALNGGGPLVRVSATSGTVYLRRQR